MLLIELEVNPLDKGESIVEPVARVVDIIDRSGLNYRVGPLGTTIEGEWDEVMKVVHQCLSELEKDSDRIVFSLRGDWHRGIGPRLQNNINKVEQALGRPLSH